MIPGSLIAADRRHHTCLRDARSTAGLSRRPAKYRAKKTKGLEPHPKTVSDTVHRQELSHELRCVGSWSGNRQPVLRHARGVSAQSQSSVCVAVTPGGNRGPPLWFTALLLRVLEAFECLSVDSVCSRLGQPDGRHGELAVPSCWSQKWSAG